MARFAVVLITALAMCCVAAQGASAASPVANVQCSVADDGAGFTSVQLVADGEVRHPGAHPATAPCGAGSSASPPPTALSGGCPPPADNPPPCNGSASASASASTAATLSSSGATLSATATGRAQA